MFEKITKMCLIQHNYNFFLLYLQTVRTEGVMAMYKGFVPTWVRLGPWNIIVSLTHREKKILLNFLC